MALAQRVTITVQVQHKEAAHTAAELVTAFHSASAPLKRSIVQNILMNLAIEKGYSVGHPDSGLCLTVMSAIPENTPVVVNKGTLVSIISPQGDEILTKDASTSTIEPAPAPVTTTLPGLEKAFQALLEVVSYPLLYPHYLQALHIDCPKGVLLYGPPGVGKTYLVATVAQYCRARMVTILGPEILGPYLGESEEKLRQKFLQAQRMVVEDPSTPVLIFIDELDALTPHRADAEAQASRVVAQLLTLMDGIVTDKEKGGRVVVVAATNRPNAIDPALRRPGRFDREVGVDVPGPDARARILRSLTKEMPLAVTDEEMEQLAKMTNGFVGADLEALCRESALHAVYRMTQATTTYGAKEGAESRSPPHNAVKVTMQDFQRAFRNSSPSLQRGYGVMMEPVQWSDIGGLASVKQQLQQAVEWPMLYKDTFQRLGLRAPRGILLYGPPGCSKTTLVKAIATTSGASFLSVNGAALYSSFVGESEKIIRQTFHQARLAAPSIIFLDELDTMVGKRQLSSGGSGSGGESVQERVLSTMLNEMDGVEQASGVLVVGATNRQDLIDKALLRPGRFDRVVYVPPPDLEARIQILKIYTRGIPLASDVDLESLAQRTELYTGADLQNVCREAAMLALRQRVFLKAGPNATALTGTPAQPGEPPLTVVEDDDFEQALRVVKPSLTKALLAEYSSSGTRAF
ncbi:hypothetical protein BGZ73_003196 [Actinomortierella ambigua]|nr:hypothetical protein BGZ73_003196 [Actinomortierella ambigua]